MINAVPRPRQLHLHRERTRHGAFVWYVRVNKGPRIRLRAEFGTPEFDEEYRNALDGKKPVKTGKSRVGSLAWLWERYRETEAWTRLSRATRRQRENIMLHVLETAGREPYSLITRKAVEEGKDRRRETPAQARNFLDTMRGLFRWALKAEHVTADPTAGVENPAREDNGGFPAWTLDDVAQYEAKWKNGTRQRVWLHVLLYVGVRRGDAVTLGRQHVKNGVITFATEKGRKKKRIIVTRRIEPELAATLVEGPCGNMAFICGERGTPLTKESFGNDFKVACVDAGLKNRSAHGLRKLSATMWADRGATAYELMAMFGWLTLAMAEHYTREADRRRLALNAHARLLGTPVEHSIPAPGNKVRATCDIHE